MKLTEYNGGQQAMDDELDALRRSFEKPKAKHAK
jgi:hypothetical protein